MPHRDALAALCVAALVVAGCSSPALPTAAPSVESVFRSAADSVHAYHLVQVGTGYGVPTKIVVDDRGRVLLTDGIALYRITPPFTGPTHGTLEKIPLAAGWDPVAVALDSDENIYVANGKNGDVLQITRAGKQAVVARSLSLPILDIALDRSGDLFISQFQPCVVIEITPPLNNSFRWPPIIVGYNPFNVPASIATDREGDVYVASTPGYTPNVVEVLPPFNVGTPVQVGHATLTSYTSSIAVDAGGSVFEARRDGVLRVSPPFVAPTYGQERYVSALSGVYKVAVDSAGSLYVSRDSIVWKLVP